MPLTSKGMLTYEIHGATDHAKIHNKIQEMRRELLQLQHVLNTLDARVQSKQPLEQLEPQFSLLYNWYLSVTESWIAMSWVAFGKEKTREGVWDLVRRLSSWSK